MQALAEQCLGLDYEGLMGHISLSIHHLRTNKTEEKAIKVALIENNVISNLHSWAYINAVHVVAL